ncbi:MAG TPA: MerR family transcriptional regulator [Kofleriaceae bacterium]|nr:MerR family transcriptional regulator [Kofleriaceae bacterium]
MSPSTPSSRARWTIAELSDRASAALEASGYQAPANGQVRAVPDLRTIRYYTSLGLLDRPIEMRGRTALYGARHLYQLCAIKRLQAEGRALGEVQAELAGLDDRALARVARISADALAVAREEAEVEAAPSARRSGAFWSAAPAPVASKQPAASPAGAVRVLAAAKIQLAPGVQLEIAPPAGAFDATLRSEDAARLVRAAAPLLEELRRQGLIGAPHQEERE